MQPTGAPLCLLLLCQLFPGKVSARQGCKSGRLTSLGGCCDLCPQGYGVAVPCGSSNTECEPCRENGTFSSISSATEPCQPCSRCPEHVPVVEACTPTHDTVCAPQCAPGHYLPAENGSSSQCLPCQVCGQGYGAAMPCRPTDNTVCQKCPEGFYSEEKSYAAPCLPCRLECNEDEVMIRACSPASDTLCMDRELQILKRTEGDPRKAHPKKPPLSESEGSASPNNSSEFLPPVPDNSKNIIPVYCSILAAVVVGLLAYVAFKCWNTCKQKKQLAKARAGELGASPEGEKLHSDSGVFLDTHSLQEHHPLNKAHKAEPRLYSALPPPKQEEVEQLLESSSHGKDWRCLASQLGYEDEAIDTFGRGEAPAHTLLSDWSAKEGATLEALCAALAGIERPDVVENLTGPTEASSVV
ncbi:tumor necrosis factor receptor superfamily member 16-like [Caretta caretta]|uniref:tumor necrosis factor receptor superfamily member 16-like n=1 Tax=Caretta caretta TaxID=8467 RepID=UPI003D553229